MHALASNFEINSMQLDISNSLSTSSENISADVRLSFGQKLSWLYRCHQNNGLPLLGVDQRIEFINFEANVSHKAGLEDSWGNPPVSPSRFLCDSFWSALDLSSLYSKRPIRALEVGCGTGRYGLNLKQKLGEELALYRGVDIIEDQNWEEQKALNNFEFYVDKAENVQHYLSDINLIFTQSALEHFEHDLVFFRQLAEYVNSAQEPIWQVHLIPSAECLQTFLWHGYRQYTPRTISKITSLFSDGEKISIYRLGGISANRIHIYYITLPSLFGTDLREKISKKYVADAVAAIQRDQKKGARTAASFYALVIKSSPGPH